MLARHFGKNLIKNTTTTSNDAISNVAQTVTHKIQNVETRVKACEVIFMQVDKDEVADDDINDDDDDETVASESLDRCEAACRNDNYETDVANWQTFE